MIANSQRIQILARRFELVREYAALHSERMELHICVSLRYRLPGSLRPTRSLTDHCQP